MSELSRSWRDHDDAPTTAPPPPGPDEDAFYAPIGDFQGAAYARNMFARATDVEVGELAGLLALTEGDRVLDVGCGNGRHLRAAAAAHGVRGVGVDVSRGLIAAARDAAAEAGVAGQLEFVCRDARELADAVAPASFDVAWSLHQGAVGTGHAADQAVLAAVAAALRPGGRLAVTVYHALFAARHLAPGDSFDPVHLLHHHRAEVRGPDDERRSHDLWTTTYTVPGAVALITGAGLEVRSVRGAEPGTYGGDGVGLDDPELLVIALAPG